MNRTAFFFILPALMLLIDWYVWQAVKTLSRSATDSTQRTIAIIYWGFTGLALLVYLAMQFLPPDTFGKNTRTFLWASIVIPYFSKVFAILIILVDDIGRLFRWVVSLFYKPEVREAVVDSTQKTIPSGEMVPQDAISRSDFLMKTALVVGSVPLVGFTFGILSGAHDYRIRRIKLPLKNLPSGFNGIKIAQLSDIHSGSFFNRTAVKGGVEMLLREKPDLVFFTGDLVNSHAEEVNEFITIFDKVKSPLGVFSTLGNHDYGKYVRWESQQAERQNVLNVIAAHKQMGWNILLDENRILDQNGDKLALIGVQNLGFGPAALRAGNLAKAYQGTQEAPVKLLLSHDPTHWDAQVRPDYSDIDVTFSGHTHGAQFGVEIPGVRWSPAQYFYKQWAGLYQEGDQRLYVNRGFGYIGYPGRVGILPEITVFELVKS
ncbi:metallophosphoesterase [Spirosoma montaniterrae]|uniref:DNA mismatch repair protein MutT n=1 Tax=Spirosoma montaniterrae TaxID=1178516 RepID=A0A1P9X1N3_9BACT|nr:metallophosphoesterase [Spirosoma montaniterrae]AQG81505.1 DNA mismatch repair protein MutT [Spirosoma montaniterrae]